MDSEEYPDGAGSVPNNVLVVNVSQRRSALAILNAREENSGSYMCTALSHSDMERASTSVSVSVGEYLICKLS